MSNDFAWNQMAVRGHGGYFDVVPSHVLTVFDRFRLKRKTNAEWFGNFNNKQVPQ